MKKLCILLVLMISLIAAKSVHGEVLNQTDDYIYKKNYSFSAAQLTSITYGNNMFVAVGNKGIVKLSVDGINWVGIKSLPDDGHLA